MELDLERRVPLTAEILEPYKISGQHHLGNPQANKWAQWTKLQHPKEGSVSFRHSSTQSNRKSVSRRSRQGDGRREHDHTASRVQDAFRKCQEEGGEGSTGNDSSEVWTEVFRRGIPSRTKGSFNSNSFNLGTSDSSAIPREDARFKWIQLT